MLFVGSGIFLSFLYINSFLFENFTTLHDRYSLKYARLFSTCQNQGNIKLDPIKGFDDMFQYKYMCLGKTPNYVLTARVGIKLPAHIYKSCLNIICVL